MLHLTFDCALYGKRYVKLAEILRIVLIEYHATSSGLEMDLNGVSESN